MKRGHVPMRTCVGCRQTKPKPELLRLVLSGKGRGKLDANRRCQGRGSYLCRSLACYQKALKRGSFEEQINVNELIDQIVNVTNTVRSEDDQKGC